MIFHVIQIEKFAQPPAARAGEFLDHHTELNPRVSQPGFG
jgi:hypothetical protein